MTMATDSNTFQGVKAPHGQGTSCPSSSSSSSSSPSPSTSLQVPVLQKDITSWFVKGKRGRRGTTNIPWNTYRPPIIYPHGTIAADHGDACSSSDPSVLSAATNEPSAVVDAAATYTAVSTDGQLRFGSTLENNTTFSARKKPRLLVDQAREAFRVPDTVTSAEIATLQIPYPLADQPRSDKFVEVIKRNATHTCDTCGKTLDSHHALGGHKSSHYKRKESYADHDLELALARSLETSKPANRRISNRPIKPRVHTCKVCGMSFNKGQSLGGHMRKHWTPAPGAAAPTSSFGVAASAMQASPEIVAPISVIYPDRSPAAADRNDVRVVQFDLNDAAAAADDAVDVILRL